MLDVVEVAVCVASLALCSVTEEPSNIGVTLDVCGLCKVQVAAVSLGLARECGFEIF